eukprot:256503-Amphidinium_carterae.1
MWVEVVSLPARRSGVFEPTSVQAEIWGKVIAGQNLLCFMHHGDARRLSILVPVLEKVRLSKTNASPTLVSRIRNYFTSKSKSHNVISSSY